jgi:hypothetical protein
VASVSRVLVFFLILAAVACAAHPRASTLPQGAPSEKDERTPAQRKINSRLLYEIYRLRGVAVQKNVPPGPTGVKIDSKGRAHVDVRAVVTDAFTRKLLDLGATRESISLEQHSILAWIALLQLERVADDPAVRAIEPAAEPVGR